MAYSAYDQFIKTAGKFPRWTNIRRRPTESNGGKILRSVFEEHKNVIQAIEEYKKDFFIKYYNGREDDFLAVLYVAQVGDIEDLDTFILTDPVYNITEDETVFYADDRYAFYNNGYIALYDTNENNTLSYSYKGEPYTAELVYTPVWNVFDEFAWWCGLERFDKEDNASLEQRCLSQFRRKPNSTQQGLKNAIINAASAKGTLKPEEIEFVEPDETSLAWLNEDGITLYEEISQVNRDLARTRKWDVDYWDNAFRKLRYLPHVWDAEMEICRNGVGYHDALKVSTIHDVAQKNRTDVTINGYKIIEAEVEAYLLRENIKQDVELGLKKYSNDIIPLNVHYRIRAEDLIPVTDPRQILFSFYKQYIGGQNYNADMFVTEYTGLDRVKNNTLQKNKRYKLVFSPSDNKGKAMEISRCDLVENGIAASLLSIDQANYNKEFRLINGHVVNASILLHATKVADLARPVNLIDNPQEEGGIVLDQPLQDGSFDINLRDWGTWRQLPQLNIDIDENSGWNDITGYTAYIRPNGFKYDTNWYESSADPEKKDSLVIKMPAHTCRKLTLRIEPKDKEVTDAAVNIDVFVGGEKDGHFSRPKLYISSGYTYSFQQDDTSQDVTIIISRHSAAQVIISNIQVQSYDIEIVCDNGERIPYRSNMSIPSTPENGHMTCVIHRNGNPASPLVRSCHIGPWQTNKEYIIENITPVTDDARLEIETNCKISLWNITDNVKVTDFDNHYTYINNGRESTDLILDLSSFDKIYKTIPSTSAYSRNHKNVYYHTLQPGESIRDIYIHGTGYKLDRILSLADLIHLDGEEQLYFARSFNGFIVKKGLDVSLRMVPYDTVHFGDKISVTSGVSGRVECCFIVSGELERGTSYTGAFDYICLYDPTAKEYIIDGDESIFEGKTSVYLNPVSSPAYRENALLSYRIEGVSPSDKVSIYYEYKDSQGQLQHRDWSVSKNDPLTITTSYFNTLDENNLSFVSASSTFSEQTVPLSNTVSLNGFTDSNGQALELSRYIISPPDDMEISYIEDTYKQAGYEDGSGLYITSNRFNKLYYSNIVEITQIIVNNIVYNSRNNINDILTLLPEAGIIYWKDEGFVGGIINQVDYIYKKPVALRFKDFKSLYNKLGYSIGSAVQSVNVKDYKVLNKEEGKSFGIDSSYFSEEPDKIVATCSNPCYRAAISGNTVTVSKIAEDYAPVIHHGFYYVDGKEYYFFANKYKKDINKFYGVSIDNAETVDNILYLYQESVNHLENSRMDKTQLTTHCMINFRWPRAQTNIDTLGHIGACESFSVWEDRNAGRSLATYKNGLATKFVIQDNGYALLDITKFLVNHTTISCLYSGDLVFTLAREIPILGQRSVKNIFCEPVQSFDVYQDIAYCIVNTDTSVGRYYLVVQGNGILDEILIHDFKEPDDIVAHHVKAIDKLGLHITERNKATSSTIEIEYTPDFIRYNCLETDQDDILRTGTTVDWNITKAASFDINDCKITRFLSRGSALVAQSNDAVIETKPIEIKYKKSIQQAAFTVNQYVQKNYQGFTVSVYGSATKDGVYREIIKSANTNVVIFYIGSNDKFLKFKIEADEDKIVTDLSLFYIYREVAAEDLGIFTYVEGSAVTKVFDIGASGNYKFRNIRCAEGLDQYESIYIRGAKKNTSEYVWTSWKNTADNPEFYDCALFQYKICMKGKDAKLKILAFEFEVL